MALAAGPTLAQARVEFVAASAPTVAPPSAAAALAPTEISLPAAAAIPSVPSPIPTAFSAPGAVAAAVPADAAASEADGAPAATDSGSDAASLAPESSAAARARLSAGARAAHALVSRVVADWSGAPADADAPLSTAARALPRAARALRLAGGALVLASAAAFAAPALVPHALAAAPGPALYAGFGLMTFSRHLRRAPSPVAGPRAPPAEPTGRLTLFKSAWRWAAYGADAQAALESRAGDRSFPALRNWWLGGLRSAAQWMPVAMAGMLVGWGLAKPLARFARPGDPVGTISFDALQNSGLGGQLLGYVAQSLSQEVAALAVFDGTRALAERLGAGRSAPWIAGAASLAVSAGLLLLVTGTPSVVVPLLGIHAALLWLRVRSNSWLAPLALRGGLALFSLEAARFGLVLLSPAAGTLAGLPWFASLAVSGLMAAALAISAGSLRPSALGAALARQFARVREFGARWKTPREDGAPHSPLPLLRLAALCGTALYAFGDLVFAGVHLIAGGVEPTPPVLTQMLTSPADLVLYNFLLVGFLEEFIFRRGLFRSLHDRLKSWGLTRGRLLWTAAVVSGLIFSGAHYIDYGALLAKIGLGSASAASGMGGAYAFTWAGFAARAALGAALAWIYAASGSLLLPIFAHFFADSLEGLGLHWGFWPFLAMIGTILLLQRFPRSRRR